MMIDLNSRSAATARLLPDIPARSGHHCERL
jgi:hypothetical protein